MPLVCSAVLEDRALGTSHPITYQREAFRVSTLWQEVWEKVRTGISADNPLITIDSDSLLRHIKDQHGAAGDHARTKDTGSGLSSLASPRISSDMLDHLSSETEQQSHANVPQQLLGDGTEQSFAAGGTPWQSDFSQGLLLDGDNNIGLDAWLTTENLDGFLHNWDFAIDNPQLVSATDEPEYSNSKPAADLQEFWYTHLENNEPAVSGYVTPVPRQKEVDDNYRQTLHRRLQIRSHDQTLPSADFLNLCIRSYFKTFHPLFPIVHAPTFRPTKTNSVLLLSICSIGSLLTGHPNAVQRGIQLFERLNKAILDHWEQLMRGGPEVMLATTQAALLGQTFGLLSGQSKHLALVDAFHGTVISWARRAKLFQTEHSPPFDQQDLDSRWRSWVRAEEKIRVALGLRIHDAELANLLHHETLLPSVSRVSHAGSDALFFASSPQEWLSLYKGITAQPATPSSDGFSSFDLAEALCQRLISIPEDCLFTLYAALEDISSAIVEARVNDSLNERFTDKVEQCLLLFYRRHLHESTFEPLRVGGRVLWHYLFILLHADLNLLERSIGRDGAHLEPPELARIDQWASSSSAKRCVAHAILIHKSLEHFPLTSEPAIHIPRIMFASAVCLLCHSKYDSGGNIVTLKASELQLLRVDADTLVKDAKGALSTDVGIGPLCGLADLLQRIGHWNISRMFASILGIVLEAECG